MPDTILLRVSSHHAVSGTGPADFEVDLSNHPECVAIRGVSVEAVNVGGHAMPNFPEATSATFQTNSIGVQTIGPLARGQYDIGTLITYINAATTRIILSIGADGRVVSTATDGEAKTMDIVVGGLWWKLGFDPDTQSTTDFTASTLVARFMPRLAWQMAYIESRQLCDSAFSLDADSGKEPFLCEVGLDQFAFGEMFTYSPPSHADKPSVVFDTPISLRRCDIRLRIHDGLTNPTMEIAGDLNVLLRLWL